MFWYHEFHFRLVTYWGVLKTRLFSEPRIATVLLRPPLDVDIFDTDSFLLNMPSLFTV